MALYVSFYEAAGRVNCARAIVSPCLSPSGLQHPDSPRGLGPREVPSSFYSRSEWRGDARRRRSGVEGGGAIYATVLGQRPRRHSRSPTHRTALASLGQDTDLTFPLVDVDANMIHGWPLLTAALTASSLLWGSVCHHVRAGGQPLHPIYALPTGQGVLDRPDGSRCPSYGRQYRTDRHKPGLALSARDRIP
jgi:hypothetical protein